MSYRLYTYKIWNAVYFAKIFQFQFIFFSHRVVMMGDSGVGKTALVSQFMTSEYMHVYDASLGKSQGKYSDSLIISLK